MIHNKCKHTDTAFVDGKRTCTLCGAHVVRLGDAVAKPGFAPHDWQSTAPASIFPGRSGPPVGGSADLDRILALPRRDAVEPGTATSEALIELTMDKFSLGERACRCREIDPVLPNCITRFLPVQAWMLHEMETADGLIGAVPVGGGKEMVGLLAPLAFRNCRRALLLMPASLMDQVETNYLIAGEHFRVPKIVIHRPSGDRKVNNCPGCAPDAPTLHVLPYTKLSSVKSSDWITELLPDLVIANECDALKDLTSARSMRVMRHFAEHGDVTRFAGWTGSLTDSSVKEYAHLCLLALRERSPMPMSREAVEEWSRCLDAVPSPAPPGELLRMCEPGESVREGFRRRLSDTEGFVMVGGEQVIQSIDGGRVELIVRSRTAPPIPEIIHKALRLVRADKRPDTLGGSKHDKDIEDPLEKSRLLKEVASGMFYRWIFPRGEPEDLIDQWFLDRAAYTSMSREIQLRGEIHLDSPKLVENACRRGWGELPEDRRLPSLRLPTWPAWREIKDLVQPKQAAVRLDPYVVDDAAKWAEERPGIVWYMMAEYAEWMRERHGITVFGGGTGEDLMKERGDRSIAASLKAHGRGRDRLQFAFSRQIFPQVPSSSRMWEQALGRLHRHRQLKELVETFVYLHTPELRSGFEQALRRAEYVEETTGAHQKLIYGWEPGSLGDDDEG